MGSWHDFLRQAFWLAVFTIPIPAGAFAVHSAESVLVSFASFAVLGTLIPFFYFQVQRSGCGIQYGKERSAIHLVASLSVMALFLLFAWFVLPQEELLWKEQGAVLTMAAVVPVMLAVVVGTLALDYGLAFLYERIRGEKKRHWAALCFFSGMIPGVILCALLLLSFTGLDRGAVFFLFLTTGITWVLYLKIVLAMMAFPFYLYFSLEGTRARRMLQVFFSAVLWLILVYLPIVLSLRLPGMGLWRVYADPAYLTVVPFLSDAWLVGLAYLGGRKITEWIYAAAEK